MSLFVCTKNETVTWKIHINPSDTFLPHRRSQTHRNKSLFFLLLRFIQQTKRTIYKYIASICLCPVLQRFFFFVLRFSVFKFIMLCVCESRCSMLINHIQSKPQYHTQLCTSVNHLLCFFLGVSIQFSDNCKVQCKDQLFIRILSYCTYCFSLGDCNTQ